MNVESLNDKELQRKTPAEASWHQEFADSAYIWIGNLPSRMTEGDLLIMFSQYGNPVHIKIARNKRTGNSLGFAFLKYEDQRSTILAVDNLNGTSILNCKLRVNHTRYILGPGEIIPSLDELYSRGAQT